MAGRGNFDDEQLPIEMHLTVRRLRADEVIGQPFVGFDEVRIPVTIEIPMTPELRAHIRRLSGSMGTGIAERGADNGRRDERRNEMRSFPTANTVHADGAEHAGRRTRSTRTTSSAPREPDSTAPEVLLDGHGKPVITPDGPLKGQPMLRPAGLAPESFIRHGSEDKQLEEQLLRQGSDRAELAELGYETGALAKFYRGAAWDAQRIGGHYNKDYVDYATVAIGLYAAANGISRDNILRIQNVVARESKYEPGTHFDSTYKHLPIRNVMNTDLGYRLYKSYSERNRDPAVDGGTRHDHQ